MLKIKGLKKVAGETKRYLGKDDAAYLQLNYDKRTGELWTDYHYSYNYWIADYEDEAIEFCGMLRSPMTMAEIREIVECVVLGFEGGV